MNRHEQDIIDRLSVQASQPRPEFVVDLKQQLTDLAQDKAPKPKGILPMFANLQLYGLLGGLISILVIGGLVFIARNDDGQVAIEESISTSDGSAIPLALDQAESEAQEDTMAGFSALSLPTTQYDSLESATDAIGFSPVIPGSAIDGEAITAIESYDGPAGNGEQTLAITFSKNGEVLYKLTQGRYEAYVDETAQSLELTFKDQSIEGRLTTFDQPDDLGEQAISFDGGEVARSFISWSKDGVSYELSEFGNLSQEQLLQIIALM